MRINKVNTVLETPFEKGDFSSFVLSKQKMFESLDI